MFTFIRDIISAVACEVCNAMRSKNLDRYTYPIFGMRGWSVAPDAATAHAPVDGPERQD